MAIKRRELQAPANVLTIFLSFMIILLIVGKGPGPDMLLLDRFHSGEFFANSMEYIGNGFSSQRGLPIHGLLDILPTLLTSKIWGEEYNFIPTVAFIKFLDLGSAVLLVILAARLASQTAQIKPWILVALSTVAPFVVGHRDFILLLSLLLMVRLLTPTSKNKSLSAFLLFGAISSISIFYCYDRGISGTVSLGITTIYLAFYDRRFVYAIGAFFVTILFLQMMSDLFSVSWYLRNIQYLMASSPEWRYDWNFETTAQVFVALSLNGMSLYSLWTERSSTMKQPERMALYILLTVLSLLMVKIGTNRADLDHILMTLWVPCLIAALRAKSIAFILSQRKALSFIVLAVLTVVIAFYLAISINRSAVLLGIIQLFIITIIFDFKARKIIQYSAISACIFSQTIYGVTYVYKSFYKNQYYWATKIWSPPSNIEVSEPVVIWAAQKIKKSGATCLFDMTNSGLINGLTLLPSCSRFTYPIYAATPYEDLLISDLRKENPPIIIYSSEYWSYNIDGQSMKDRYKTLDTYLRTKFPIETCNADYCVREKA